MPKFTIYYGSAIPMKAVGKHQCRLLEFAEKYRGWHTYAQDRTTKRAVEDLHRKGYLEVIGDQFRFCYPAQ